MSGAGGGQSIALPVPVNESVCHVGVFRVSVGVSQDVVQGLLQPGVFPREIKVPLDEAVWRVCVCVCGGAGLVCVCRVG